MIFILSGFEHSIANMFYFSLANEWGTLAIIQTIIAIVGNGVGSWIINKTNFLIQDNND
jgi:formate/nitrite transporter FocA (FNT family)